MGALKPVVQQMGGGETWNSWENSEGIGAGVRHWSCKNAESSDQFDFESVDGFSYLRQT